MYAAGLNESRRALYYLSTPPPLFDPFVDQVDTAELREGAVVVVDSRFGRDLASAHPMDAALRRILDETSRCGWICPRSYFFAVVVHF